MNTDGMRGGLVTPDRSAFNRRVGNYYDQMSDMDEDDYYDDYDRDNGREGRRSGGSRDYERDAVGYQ
jgi:hypothetical protein